MDHSVVNDLSVYLFSASVARGNLADMIVPAVNFIHSYSKPSFQNCEDERECISRDQPNKKQHVAQMECRILAGFYATHRSEVG